MENNDPLFARPANHPLGPCDAEVKTLLPEWLKDQLNAIAVVQGKTLSEYVRDVLSHHTVGAVGMMQRAAAVAQSGYRAGNSG